MSLPSDTDKIVKVDDVLRALERIKQLEAKLQPSEIERYELDCLRASVENWRRDPIIMKRGKRVDRDTWQR